MTSTETILQLADAPQMRTNTLDTLCEVYHTKRPEYPLGLYGIQGGVYDGGEMILTLMHGRRIEGHKTTPLFVVRGEMEEVREDRKHVFRKGNYIGHDFRLKIVGGIPVDVQYRNREFSALGVKYIHKTSGELFARIFTEVSPFVFRVFEILESDTTQDKAVLHKMIQAGQTAQMLRAVKQDMFEASIDSECVLKILNLKEAGSLETDYGMKEKNALKLAANVCRGNRDEITFGWRCQVATRNSILAKQFYNELELKKVKKEHRNWVEHIGACDEVADSLDSGSTKENPFDSLPKKDPEEDMEMEEDLEEKPQDVNMHSAAKDSINPLGISVFSGHPGL